MAQQYPPQYPQQYPPSYPPPASPAPSNTLALVSMIVGFIGILGLPACCCGMWVSGAWFLVFGAGAAITGYLARQQIVASGGQQGGAGQAQAGLIMGIIEAVLGLLFLCLAVVSLTGAIVLPSLQNITNNMPSF